MNNPKPSGLLRILGLGFGIAVLVGNSVGSGILRMPGDVAAYISNGWLAVCLWLLAGLLALAGAVIYAEVSTAYPFAGGPYAISEKVFGKQAGFSVGFIDWILNTAGNATLAIAGAEYINSFFGLQLPISLAAITIVLIVCTIQWFGIKSSSVIQQLLSLLKALGLLFLVAAFFMHGPVGDTGNIIQSTATASPVTFFGAVILSFRAILFAYAGWNSPIYFAEENADPRKDLPRSLLYGVAALTFIYVLVNASIVYLLPAQVIANSPLAVADGAYAVFGSGGKLIVTGISIIIVISALYAGILYAPRILFGISRAGSFFPFAAKLNRYQTPGLALLATAAVTIAFAASGAFNFVMAVYTFLYVFIDTIVYIAALYSRWNNKAELFFKAPAYPLLPVLLVGINLALLISVCAEDIKSSAYAAGVILLTVPLYFIFRAAGASPGTTRS